MQHLPLYISIVFILTTLLTVWFLYQASRSSKTTIITILIWLTIQSIIALTGFYTDTNTFPPRFLLLVAPPLMLIIILFATVTGRRYIDHLNTKTLTLLHVVRIPVEIVLFWLFMNKAVPQLMTFEGRNYDIFSGLTAPFIYYFGYIKNKLSKTVMLIWNFICLVLLINIVVNAVLSAPTPFQQFGFDQPNIGVLYFPFIWLPCFIVPVVLFSHLVTIRQLIIDDEEVVNEENRKAD